MSMMWSRALILAVVFAAVVNPPAFCQDATPPPAAAAATIAAAAQEDDPDLDPNPSQPDFTMINLPTTLRLPRFKSAFRVTHRFARPLGSGDFSNLIEDFFGFDSGALIGLEYRFGIFRGAQLGIHRTSDRTIEFFGQYDLLGQNPDRLFNVAALATIDGTNNFRDTYTPAIGVLASYQLGDHGAIYVEPMWVNNSNLLPDDPLEDNDTFIVGLGARLRIRPTVYVVGEFTPRVSGYDPGSNLASFGIEKRVGGHAFQLNFSNGFGTTIGQIARGSVGDNDWFIGFNISRKFF
jgi:hypothetical protein